MSTIIIMSGAYILYVDGWMDGCVYVCVHMCVCVCVCVLLSIDKNVHSSHIHCYICPSLTVQLVLWCGSVR